MHLTSIYDWGPGKLIDSSPCRHSEFTRIGLVDQEVWRWIWYLFLPQNHKQTRHLYIIKDVASIYIVVCIKPIPEDYGKKRRKSDPDETDWPKAGATLACSPVGGWCSGHILPLQS